MPMQKRTKYFTCSLLFILLFVVVIGILYLMLGREGSYYKNNVHQILNQEALISQCQPVCTSTQCILASHFIRSNINESVDPCQDFYSFSCGKWMARYGEEDNYSLFESVDLSLKRVIKGILEDTKEALSTSSEKMKIVYVSCMTERSSETEAVPSILHFLNKTGINNWPRLSADFEFEEGLEKTLGVMAVYNEFSFVIFQPPNSFPENPNGTRSHDIQAVVKYQYPVVHDDSLSANYKDLVLGILAYFDMKIESLYEAWEDFEKIDNVVRDLYLQNIHQIEACGEDLEKDGLSVRCSDVNDTLVNLCNILKFVFEEESLNIYSKQSVFVPCSSVTYVGNIFSAISHFSHRSIANYLSLRCFIAHLDDLSFAFRKIHSSHPNTFAKKPQLSKWERCVEWISNYMPYALGVEYVPRMLPKQNLDEVRKIVHEFIDVASKYTARQEWIDDKNRRNIIFAVQNLTNYIDSSVFILQNKTLVNLLYEKFIPTRESFVLNVLEYQRAMFIFYMANYKIAENFEFSSPFMVNAFHLPGVLDVRFGMLLPPIYSSNRPKLLNLATMGTSIGHEIGHEILNFFYEEDLNNITKRTFLRKKKCFESQYSQFEVKKIGKKVLGNITYSEDLPDNIGMTLTQKLIEKYLLENEDAYEFTLPGLNFTSRQLLFLSMAQMWCTVRNRENEQLHYETDIHTPPNFRIIGMMQNSKEFSEAFYCSPGRPMNPLLKCSFYDPAVF